MKRLENMESIFSLMSWSRSSIAGVDSTDFETASEVGRPAWEAAFEADNAANSPRVISPVAGRDVAVVASALAIS